MIEYENGFARIDGQLLFSVTAEDIVWRMRDDWLGDIEAGHSIMMETIIPYLEREAVGRFVNEWTIQHDVPNIRDGYEDWRTWWLNEASHNCDTHSPIGRAGKHLSQIGQSAVNILMTASALRDAIEGNKAQEAAALGMLLICEAIAAGESLKGDAAQMAHETILAERDAAYKKTIGTESRDQAIARAASITAATKMWMDDPNKRIGEVALEIHKRLLNKLDVLTTLNFAPAADTIRGWLKAAAKDGKLNIPAAAQRRGRSPKAPA